MLKKVFAFSMMVALLVGTVGCFTTNDRHNRNHLRSFEGDADSIHATIDRHFFNYDWDDPTDY